MNNAIFILCLFLCACASKTEFDLSDPIIQLAEADVRRDLAEPYSMYGAAFGMCCGCIGIPMTIVVEPDVPINRYIGRSPKYIDAYTTMYKKQQHASEIQASVAGCFVNGVMVSIASCVFYYHLQ